MNRKVLVAGIPENVTNYIAALEAIGCEPVVALELPTAEGLDLSDFAGLLLPGGSDIDPALFGEKNKGSRTIHRELDEKQLALARIFAEAEKPILGICKGCQVLNVCFGGNLIQDLPNHDYHQWNREREEDEHHGAVAVGKNWISRLYGTDMVTINSAHHQAIDRLGEGLVVCQKSDDGVIEAVCHETKPIFATQWHPERMTGEWKAKHPDTVTARTACVDGGLVFNYFLQRLQECDQ